MKFDFNREKQKVNPVSGSVFGHTNEIELISRKKHSKSYLRLVLTFLLITALALSAFFFTSSVETLILDKRKMAFTMLNVSYAFQDPTYVSSQRQSIHSAIADNA